MTIGDHAPTMRAIVQDSYGSADVLRLEDIPRPEVRAGEVLVRVHAAGVDPGVRHVMTGLPYLLRLFGFGLRAPKVRVRGLDLAGRVEAVGAGVTRLRVGDEVFGVGEGACAEFARARAEHLAIKPAGLGFEQAAAVPGSGLAALQALRDQGRVQAGQKVLVVGAAGGVGAFAVQIAAALGAEVTGVCSTTSVDLVRSIGAHEVIDYTREEFTDGSRSFDLIIDTAGGRSLSRLRRALTRRGTLVIVGAEGGGRWFGGADRQLRAMLLSPFVSQRLCGLMSVPRQADLETLRGMLESGQLRPLVDRTYALGDAAEAVRALARPHARGKLVLTV
jgi:NADPH:quinone reductase-like Zn-dependent oxidoreductase